MPKDNSLNAQKTLLGNVVEVLADLGLAPRDIHFLICTHFDPDHSGHHDEFPWSQLIVQRAHYEAARSGGHVRFTLTREHWDHPDLRYRLIDGDTELVPGVELIETSGHTTGHQSVLVRLPKTGPVLLAIDAVAMEKSFQPDRKAGPFDENFEQVRASTHKLLTFAQREQVSLHVFGHDENLWPALKKAPEFYD